MKVNQEMIIKITGAVLVIAFVFLVIFGIVTNVNKGESLKTGTTTSGNSSTGTTLLSSGTEFSKTDYEDSSEPTSNNASTSILQSSSPETTLTVSTPSTTTPKKPDDSEYKVFSVENYGAKGDGKTDDGKAIETAVAAAIAYKKAAIVRFRSNATYIVNSIASDVDGNYVIRLNEAKNVKIEGSNTTIKTEPSIGYVFAGGGANIEISGINFDFTKKPSVVCDVSSIDVSARTIVVETPYKFDFPSGGNEFSVSGDYFGIPDVVGRHHMFIDKFVRVSDKKYRIHFRQDDNITARLNLMKAQNAKFICPVPGSAYHRGEVFAFISTTNLSMKNCEIWSAVGFVFNIRGNLGAMNFTNVNIRPQPGTSDKVSGWRDGFHCKDNKARIDWTNCIVKGLNDDTFNISATMLDITKVFSESKITVKCQEYGGNYFGFEAGDELSFYNVNTGKYVGDAVVTKLVSQSNGFTLELDRSVSGLTTAVKAIVTSRSAPGSTIKNCDIEGTVRYRGKLTVENTKFKLLQMWIENEVAMEGPIPKNIIFKNCKFTGFDNSAKFITIKTVKNGSGTPSYYCENIVFDGCEINKNNVSVSHSNSVTYK